MLSISRTTAGDKFRGCRRNVRKTSVNTVLYVSTSGSLQGSDGKSGSASQCLSPVKVPDCQEQYRFLRQSSVTCKCKRCQISVSMSDDKQLTRRRLLILAGLIWTNKSSKLLSVTAQVCRSFMDPS